jgi:hypothetical protein
MRRSCVGVGVEFWGSGQQKAGAAIVRGLCATTGAPTAAVTRE